MEHSRPSRLTRSHDHVLGGVAAGLAEYLDIDPTIVRVGWVLAVVFGLPLAILAYLILWVIMPSPDGREAGDLASGRAEPSRDNSALLLGIVLIVVGALFLLPDRDLLPWFGWRLIHVAWPIVLILGGLLLLMRSRRASE
jgi:phage shock protein PspC (stress-responsive transcriptional regulator)